MRHKRETVRETSYKTKDLVVGYQILMLRSQNETQKHLISPANPSLRVDAHDEARGLHSTLDLKLADNMSLELHQNALGIPALLDGKDIGSEVRYIDHGSVLQIGQEIIKVKKIEIKLGAKGTATQRVYSSDRRFTHRDSAGRWGINQGFLMFAIVISAVLFGILSH
jgi:hypothetical protein